MSAAGQERLRQNGTALRMTGISKRFGPVQALRSVSLEVQAGTVHALVGENGAGKSTLMKILAGVYQPDTGTVEIHGQPRTFANPADAMGAGVSMIYQELDLAEHLTVAENIFLGAEPAGADASAASIAAVTFLLKAAACSSSTALISAWVPAATSYRLRT